MRIDRHWIVGPILALAVWVLLLPNAAWAQASPHPVTPTDGPSSLPPGDGTLRGVVVDAAAPEATAGLTVALYALQPDGTPGIGSARTADDGSFEFTSISSDPAIVYLVGARYEQVPYGERTAFVPGQTVIDLMLPVSRPTTDASALVVLEATLHFESLGSQIAVRETHKLGNTGKAPIYVPDAARAGREAPFRAKLPTGATNFQTGAFNSNEGFVQRGSDLLFWGPIYTDEQEIRYGYTLPVASGASKIVVEKQFPLGTGSIRVLSPEHGPRVESADLISKEAVEVEGSRLALQESGAREPGSAIALTLHVPETSSDTSRLSLGRAEFSVELDDTVLEVTHNQKIEVAAGAHLAGTSGAPLLRFDLPITAQLIGLSTGAEQLGVSAVDVAFSKAVEVYGPLGPGSHDFAFRYRLPAEGGKANLDLQFPKTVPTLQLRAADTGLLIENDRLHRLRPQAIGTRTWMMREAFHVEPDEIVRIHFEALDQSGPSLAGRLFFVAVASAFVLLFVVGPLRKSRVERAIVEADREGFGHERDLIYTTIRDLQHDFETGKVAEADYERSRAELRARAVELMRQEKQTVRPLSPVAPETPAVEPETAAETPRTGRFCPGCGERIDADWRFCSHCGVTLQPTATEASEPVG